MSFEYTHALQDALNNEVAINRGHERRIRQLLKDLAQCENEIIRKDQNIEHHEKEIKLLKVSISELRKKLYNAQKES
jgi:septal ring factor EnvC (AmiA/AmiB activator)